MDEFLEYVGLAIAAVVAVVVNFAFWGGLIWLALWSLSEYGVI